MTKDDDNNNANNKLLIHPLSIGWVPMALLPLCGPQALYPNPSKALITLGCNWLLRRPPPP